MAPRGPYGMQPPTIGFPHGPMGPLLSRMYPFEVYIIQFRINERLIIDGIRMYTVY